MSDTTNAIAVIGLAGRFPGAEDVFAYWQQIAAGRECIQSLDMDDLLAHGGKPGDLQNGHYVKAKGVLKDADLFAADFFGYSPHEAKLMDPQQRILLETAFAALENAGVLTEHYSKPIGTFVSTGFNTYLLHCLVARPELHDPQNHYQMAIGNGNDFLATRIAYKLNLTGPTQTVQTACSSSLVAIHNACQSLLNYECDAALAGGCAITAPLVSGYLYKKDGIGSPDGHCRPFDQDAAGTVPGNGAGIVVLKRLEDAIAEHDHIYAVIKSSAINNDGNKKISYTAPSIQGQEEVIRTAHALAGITPDTVSYIEAHGTGTSLGDPIEFEALTRAFDMNNDGIASCAIGSVKANIGHLDAAAGVAGFIKAVLMLHQRQLPPQINFGKPNPRIPFVKSPFYVNTELKPWPTFETPRRAGVSAFGIGGTNAHVILEEYNRTTLQAMPTQDWSILPLSAENKMTLEQLKYAIITYINEHPNLALKDVAYTLQHRRRTFTERTYLVVRKVDGALQCLEAIAPEGLSHSQHTFTTQWMAGGTNLVGPAEGLVVPLPTTPLQKDRYWMSAKPIVGDLVTTPVSGVALPLVSKFTANLVEVITQIVKEGLEEEETLERDEDFHIMGVDSLLTIDLCLWIEQRLGYQVSTGDFYKYPTIRQLAQALSARGKTSHQQPAQLPKLAVEIQRGERGAPILFCVHPAGGSVAVFDEIAAALPDIHRIIGIRAMGWDGETTTALSIEAMAEAYLAVIQQIQPFGPYYLCGSSIGGTIVFEITRRLLQQRQTLGMVVLLDSPAMLKKQEALFRPTTHEEIQRYVQLLCPKTANDLSRLAVRNPESASHFYHLWSLHAQSLECYQAMPCDVAITYFYALEKNKFLASDLVSDWFQLANDGVEVHALPGNHLTIHHGDNARRIAAFLAKKMDVTLVPKDEMLPSELAIG